MASALGVAWEKTQDFAAQLVGRLEMLGFRFPVKAYSAPVFTPKGQWTGVTRGSRRDAADVYGLAQQNYRSLLSLNKEGDSDAVNARAVGMQAFSVPILDNAHPTLAQAKQALDIMTNPANLPLFVHCEAGVGRTGQIVACYQMAVWGLSLEQALAEAAKYGKLMPNQRHFLEDFARALGAGEIAGYPLRRGQIA